MHHLDDFDAICDFPADDADLCPQRGKRKAWSACSTPRTVTGNDDEWVAAEPKPYSRTKAFLLLVPLLLIVVLVLWHVKKRNYGPKPSSTGSAALKSGKNGALPLPEEKSKPCHNCQRGAEPIPSSSTSAAQGQGEPQKIEPVPTPWGKIPAGSRGIVQRIYSEKCAACKSGKTAWDEWKQELIKSNYHVEEIEVDMANPTNPGTYYALKCNFMAVPAIRHLPSGEAAMGPAPIESLRKWIERIEREYNE